MKRQQSVIHQYTSLNKMSNLIRRSSHRHVVPVFQVHKLKLGFVEGRVSLLNEGNFNFCSSSWGVWGMLSQQILKLNPSGWLKLTFLHENYDKIHKFSPNAYAGITLTGSHLPFWLIQGPLIFLFKNPTPVTNILDKIPTAWTKFEGKVYSF